MEILNQEADKDKPVFVHLNGTRAEPLVIGHEELIVCKEKDEDAEEYIDWRVPEEQYQVDEAEARQDVFLLKVSSAFDDWLCTTIYRAAGKALKAATTRVVIPLSRLAFDVLQRNGFT